MRKKNIGVLLLFVPLLLMLISCSNIFVLNTKDDKGDFSKLTSNIMSKYEIKSTDDFFSNIKFDLKVGKVDWEITNPKGEVEFKGYVINENGATYRQLTYPPNYNNGNLNQKQKVNSVIDGGGNIVSDFYTLYFFDVPSLGVYTLSLTPTSAEGEYTILWSNGIAKK